MNRYRWEIAPPVSPSQLQRLAGLDPLIVQLLYNRELVEPAEVRAFLSGTADDDHPFQLRGMNQAVARIRRAIRTGEKIAVYGDFDVDGVTSTALLIQVLSALGAQVEPYIPHRVTEGYGLNKPALKELASRGVHLVVTVDCGVRAVDEVTYGRQLGLDLIVTDHHEPPSELPPAYALINPRQPGCRYPFKDLPGVGLAFKLAQALLRVESQIPASPARSEIPYSSEESSGLEEVEEALLDVVALGVVADLAPLVGENRRLVRRGLSALNATRRVGLQALMEVAGVQPGQVGTETISYVLGPRLNAAGRLDHARVAYQLLMSGDPAEARTLAVELDTRNRERQALTQWVLDQALDQLEGAKDAPLLMVAGRDFAPGVVGLVASRLTEQFYRPSLVLELGEKTAHGSARSIPGFNIVRALDEISDLFIKHGGHALAAGLTIEVDKIDVLRQRLLEIAERELAGVPLTPLLTIDAEWPLSRLTPHIFQLLTQLEPFGVGNPAPLLLSRDIRVRDFTVVGEEGHHLRLKLEQNRIIWDAMAFRQGHWADAMPERVDIVYTPKIEIWNGQEWLRLEVKDMRMANESE